MKKNLWHRSLLFIIISLLIFSPSSLSFSFTSAVVQAEENNHNTLRIHYQKQDGNYENWGLWTWGDVKSPTDEWPTGALSFEETEDGNAYVDVELAEGAAQIGFLVVNKQTEEKDGGDKTFLISSQNVNEIWIQEGSDQVYTYEPVSLDENQVRIHYVNESGNYENLGLWLWDDVVNPSENWPSGAKAFDGVGRYGAFVDVDVKDNASKISFLVVNRVNGQQSGDMSFSLLEDYNQLWIREGDSTVYISPYWETPVALISGEVLSTNKIVLQFTSVKGMTEAELLELLSISDKEGNPISISGLTIKNDRTVEVFVELDLDQSPFSVTFDGKTITVGTGWRMIDELYAYDGELGATLHSNGTATLKLWSPSADSVSVVLYDKNNQNNIVHENIEMTLGDRGVWHVTLQPENTGIDNVNGYYYHYKITRGEDTVLALDPYAKSMATWNNFGDDPIGKAAIVNPADIGPTLQYANIDGYEKREDAIIYEVHVRDFTSDPSIEGNLQSQFGTFTAFIDKLDYIEQLGVTHVQLLPVMSYFWANEFENNERMLEYSSSGNNYNWGYDPHSYFAPTGMYSENPDDPELRIQELKMLIDEIHKRGMGVILDVVYNHTAQVEIFEDLEPNYYHFMDADGTPRTSFGGGRLGTTHEMARRILVDSILYWTDVYKVDGFRFDMMGDHDAETIQIAYDKAKQLNPNILMIGEGWRTYVGDEGETDVMPADQDWMQYTDSVGVFSDEFRNELKSGFGSEGQPRFITGGARNVQQIFDNIKAQPHNFVADDPGDVVPYIEAHDNLTLHDVIAQSIKKDPDYHQEEIQQRIRIGNAMVLTSQGTAFIHAGQEFGRTKQYREETTEAPYKSTYMVDENGQPFDYPYFIHDSYDSSDAINMFNWEQATNASEYPLHNETREYTTGLIELRRSTDAFRLGSKALVDENVTIIEAPEMKERDLVIAYRNEATNGDAYYVFVNADSTSRSLTISEDLTRGVVLVDSDEAGTVGVSEQSGFQLTSDSIELDPLTTVIIKLSDGEEQPPTTPEEPIEEEPIDEDPKEEEPTEEEPTDEDPKEEDTSTDVPDDSKQPSQPTPTPDEEGEEIDDDKVEENEGKDSDDQENSLPKTATPFYTFMLIGFIVIVAGAIVYMYQRKQKGTIVE